MNGRADKNDEEITLKELILKIAQWRRFLLSKWLTIVITGIIGSALGLAYSFIKKPVYKAELSFALEDDRSGGGLGAAAGLASQFGFDLGGGGGGAFSGDNLLELMRSRSMVEKTLLTPINVNNKQETLAEIYISFNKLREKWEKKPELKNVRFLPGTNRSQFSLQQDSVLGEFYRSIIKLNLAVSKIDKKLSIITVTCNSENETFSKFFTEILVKTVSDFYIDTKTRKAVQNVNILQYQTDSIRRELNMAISGVASSVDAVPNANPARLILRATSQHRQVDVQADQAILTELVKNLEISKVSLRRETPLIQIIDSPILPLEKERFGKLKGLVLFGILFGVLGVITVAVKKIFLDLMKDE